MIQLEGAGCQFNGVASVMVMRAVRIGVGQCGVLARERSGGVCVHGMAVESLSRDPRAALRV